MKTSDKNMIVQMRRDGVSMAEIADKLGLPRNTVKSFCRRNGLTGDAETVPALTITDRQEQKACLCCGKPVVQYPGRKEKKFCSDKCRLRFWNGSLGATQLNGMMAYRCPVCGKQFFAYPGRNRKYCSHDCYVSARFGGAVCD